MTLRGFALVMAMVAGCSIAATAPAKHPQQQEQPPAGPGLDLIVERCGNCHTTMQVFVKRKTPADWAVVVQSMIDRGTELSPEEQKIVVDYLSANYAPPADAASPAP